MPQLKIVVILHHSYIWHLMEKEMSFIKLGDGNITDIFEEDELTDEQKRTIKEISEKKATKEESSSNKIAKKSGS